MYSTIGARLSYCRSLLGYSRPELVKLLGNLTKQTLGRWERDEIEIPPIQLDRLVLFYREYGIKISQQWILDGLGDAPINFNLENIEQLNFDDTSYLAHCTLKQSIKNLQQFFVNTNFFYPIINYGEYISGVSTVITPDIANKICYVKDHKGVTVGLFNYQCSTIINIKNEAYPIDKSSSGFEFGKVLYISKKS